MRTIEQSGNQSSLIGIRHEGFEVRVHSREGGFSMHCRGELVGVTYYINIQKRKDVVVLFFEGESNIFVPRRHVLT